MLSDLIQESVTETEIEREIETGIGEEIETVTMIDALPPPATDDIVVGQGTGSGVCSVLLPWKLRIVMVAQLS